jgi:TetR/AcrR family transcriptional regulator, cholesterol catabolism regulator
VRICTRVHTEPHTQGFPLTIESSEQSFESPLLTPPPVPRAAPHTHEQRLDRILESATLLIARDGYTKASMRTVAAAADISLAGLYHYFESKEKMLFLIQFRSFSSLLRHLEERLHGIEDPQDRLRVAVRAHIMQYARNKPALKVCAQELDALTGASYDEVLRIRRQIYRIVRSIVDQIIVDRSGDNTINAHVATMSLFGSLNWLYQWYEPGQDRSPAGLAQLMADQFLSGLLGTTSADASAAATDSDSVRQ